MELVSCDPATGRIVIAMRIGEFADLHAIVDAAHEQYKLFDPEILHKEKEEVKLIRDEISDISDNIHDHYSKYRHCR